MYIYTYHLIDKLNKRCYMRLNTLNFFFLCIIFAFRIMLINEYYFYLAAIVLFLISFIFGFFEKLLYHLLYLYAEILSVEMSFGYVGQFHFITGAHWLVWTGQQTQSVPSFALKTAFFD